MKKTDGLRTIELSETEIEAILELVRNRMTAYENWDMTEVTPDELHTLIMMKFRILFNSKDSRWFAERTTA